MALVTSTEMFRRVYEGGYAIGVFNVSSMEVVQGITEATAELKSSMILQASAGARKYMNSIYPVKLVEAAMGLHPEIPIVLYPNHSADFATYKDYIDSGFTSVIIDYSGHSFEESIAGTKKVVEYTHAHGVMVGAELDTLAGMEDDVRIEEGMSSYTKLGEVEELVSRMGRDSLAITIDTSHGTYKFKSDTKSQSRLDILEEVKKRLPGFPIVPHGASSIPQGYVRIINTNDGQLKDAIGMPEDQLREATRSAIYKINIDSDLRLGMTAGIRQHFNGHPDYFDPRQYPGDGRANVKAVVAHRTTEVLGSGNRIQAIRNKSEIEERRFTWQKRILTEEILTSPIA